MKTDESRKTPYASTEMDREKGRKNGEKAAMRFALLKER